MHTNNNIIYYKKKAEEEESKIVKTNILQTCEYWLFHMSTGNMQLMVMLLDQSCSSYNNSVFKIEALVNTGATQYIMDEMCFKAIPLDKGYSKSPATHTSHVQTVQKQRLLEKQSSGHPP